jgi:nuclear pore complex protein Nup107
MAPTLDQDFLCNPFDEQEADILTKIRVQYLPELVLGYNSVLYFAGFCLSRVYLGGCMELANQIAATPNLTEAFVLAGRMREFVSALAFDSQALLSANEAGKKKPGEKKAKALDIWSVKWKDTGKLVGDK